MGGFCNFPKLEGNLWHTEKVCMHTFRTAFAGCLPNTNSKDLNTNIMQDLFKKFVYTGVGLVATTVEKFQQSVDKLVDEDKISQDEGKKIVDDLVKNTEAKRDEFEGKLRSIIEEVMAKLNVGTQSQVKDIQDRLAAIEEKLGIVNEEAAPAEEAPAEEKKPASKKKAPAKKAAAEA